jgi:hypothetical protein
MPQRDVISWKTMIYGYSGIGNMGFAQMLFRGTLCSRVIDKMGYIESRLMFLLRCDR